MKKLFCFSLCMLLVFSLIMPAAMPALAANAPTESTQTDSDVPPDTLDNGKSGSTSDPSVTQSPSGQEEHTEEKGDESKPSPQTSTPPETNASSEPTESPSGGPSTPPAASPNPSPEQNTEDKNDVENKKDMEEQGIPQNNEYNRQELNKLLDHANEYLRNLIASEAPDEAFVASVQDFVAEMETIIRAGIVTDEQLADFQDRWSTILGNGANHTYNLKETPLTDEQVTEELLKWMNPDHSYTQNAFNHNHREFMDFAYQYATQKLLNGAMARESQLHYIDAFQNSKVTVASKNIKYGTVLKSFLGELASSEPSYKATTVSPNAQAAISSYSIIGRWMLPISGGNAFYTYCSQEKYAYPTDSSFFISELLPDYLKDPDLVAKLTRALDAGYPLDLYGFGKITGEFNTPMNFGDTRGFWTQEVIWCIIDEHVNGTKHDTFPLQYPELIYNYAISGKLPEGITGPIAVTELTAAEGKNSLGLIYDKDTGKYISDFTLQSNKVVDLEVKLTELSDGSQLYDISADKIIELNSTFNASHKLRYISDHDSPFKNRLAFSYVSYQKVRATSLVTMRSMDIILNAGNEQWIPLQAMIGFEMEEVLGSLALTAQGDEFIPDDPKPDPAPTPDSSSKPDPAPTTEPTPIPNPDPSTPDPAPDNSIDLPDEDIPLGPGDVGIEIEDDGIPTGPGIDDPEEEVILDDDIPSGPGAGNPEPVTIEDDPVPQAGMTDATLPQTGTYPVSLFTAMGLILMACGAFFIQKKQ